MPWLAACTAVGNTPAATTSCTPLLTPHLPCQHYCVSLSYYILCFLLLCTSISAPFCICCTIVTSAVREDPA
ncbi:hypothetical protein M3J07_000027 [Ascochyta lentis]